MKQNFTILLCCIFSSFAIYAQKAIAVSGGEITTANFSLSYSVGQIAQKNNSNTFGLVNQGVQQPIEIFSLFSFSTETAEDITLKIKVYPNPTTEYINLYVDNDKLLNSEYMLFDLSGKILNSEKITNIETRINLTNLPKGNYLLQVLNTEKSMLRAFKIIKN